MTTIRRVLAKCQNPRCWRHFVTEIGSRRVCCDLECDLQRAAAMALAAQRKPQPWPRREHAS
jgi:hypothetical protein